MPNFKSQNTFKGKKKFQQKQNFNNLKVPLTVNNLISQAYNCLMKELQSKFTGLYDLKDLLGMKQHFKMLFNISQVINKRLVMIMSAFGHLDTAFKLTQMYRKRHPHHTDFELIMSNLHELQDELGDARSEIKEDELLMSYQLLPFMLDIIPQEKVNSSRYKYFNQITGKISQYINSLPTNEMESDNEEEMARVRARQQLKKLGPYFAQILKEIADYQFTPATSAQVIRIYGEPFLPGREVVGPWLARFKAYGVVRDFQMFNQLVCTVPREHALALLAADGDVVDGAKLVIRPNDTPFRRIPIGTVGRKAVEKSLKTMMNKDKDANDSVQQFNK